MTKSPVRIHRPIMFFGLEYFQNIICHCMSRIFPTYTVCAVCVCICHSHAHTALPVAVSQQAGEEHAKVAWRKDTS